MNKEFQDILDRIPNTVHKRGSLIERELGKVFLEDKFNWKSTVEGNSFWSYVDKRLEQLSQGIGYKE